MNCKFLQRFSIISFLLVCSVQLVAVPMPEGWKQAANCRKDEGNFTAVVAGQEPFDIIIRGKASERNVKVTLAPTEIKAVELLADNQTADLKITRTYPAPAAPQANIEYTVKIRDNEWSFFVDGALRAIMPSIFALPGTISVQNEQAARMQGAAKFLPVPKVSFLTNFMIEEGAPNELYPWNINTGTWRLHTALQQALIRPETDQASTKRAPLTADKSPNFYSLKGGGANVDNVITTGYDFYDNYSITCSIQLEKGEGGVVFYHRDEVLPPPPEGKEPPKPDPAKAEFYAFTMRMNVPSDGQHEVRLWHQKNGVKRLIARAEVPLYANQWYLPGVAAHGDEIICYLDHYELFRVTEPLPVGGKFGMFLNTPEETRMDDVTVKHFADIKLETPEGIQFNMLHSEGNVAHGLDAAKKPQITMTDEALFALGRTQSVNRVFEATVEPKSNGWTLGLATEWTAHAAPSTRFSIARKADNSAETYTLYTATPGQENKVIETFEHVLTDAEKKATSFKLMLDATEKGKLRALKDGKLVFIWQRGNDFVGANAIWTAQGTSAVFSNLKLNTERVQIKELEQKNPIFKTDSFMRHWASPEGQWIAGKANAMWHKGDFFSDFYIKLPCIPNSDFNVAVPDDADNGPVSIVIKDGKIIFSVKEFKDKDAVVQEFALTAPEGKGIDALEYELYHEGYWLWIDVAGKTVLRHRLTGSLRSIGTRARVIGMGIPELARSKVTRTNVIDEFFNESPHDWLANGGDWQIINRFQCTPSWSHMIGEAHESLGAFWRKQIFKGDMVLEFYAGSRQGAYDEMGNLNCTIMAQDNTANSGYTVACTEWDQNLSQNWTTMYKNGIPLQKSDAYLVPRRRKGLVRKVLNPLIAQGRPYHGAWYYIKLRKIGDKLEYYFDDELIFTQKDTDVLNEGIVGIWTFIHSMTLAQIKITFDDVRPRPILVKMLPLEEPKPLPARDPFKWNTAMGLFNVDPLAAEFWTINDKVGQSTFTPFKTANGGSAFLYHNCLGSGNMLTSTTGGATAEKLSNIAGWQIKVKRTEKARFNIMYEICSKNDKGEYTANRHCFQHISGDEFTDNQWRMMGHSDVPPVAQVTAEDKDWTTITVWIPGRLRRPDDATSQRLVRLVGFGIEQLDAMMNGIWGNGPGSAYAVGDITPIFYDAPVIAAEEGAAFKVSSDAADSKFSLEATNPQQLKAMLDSVSKVGLNTATLQLTLKDRKLTRQIAWIKLADAIPFTFGWDKTMPDGVRLACSTEYPDPRMAKYSVTFEGQKLEGFPEIDGSRILRIPRNDKLIAATKTGKLNFKVAVGSQSAQTIALETAAKDRVNAAPALMKLDGFTPFFTSFEDGPSAMLQFANFPRMRVESDPSNGQSRYLMVRNTGYGQALETNFNMAYSIAQYPIVQFRYRAWDMAQISLRFSRSESHYVRLANNDYTNSVAVRAGKDFILDEQWHSWTGIVSDAFASNTFNTARYLPTRMRFGSVGSPDQTGRFSKFALDDLIAGPAAHTIEQISFTPTYYDADGVKDVFFGMTHVNSPYYDLTAAEQQAIAWTRVEPGAKIVPPADGLKPGINHIVLKAKDAAGVESNVMDLPFLWDTTNLTVSHKVQDSAVDYHNKKSLVITIADSGLSPVAVEKLKFFVQDTAKPATIPAWSNYLQHTMSGNALHLNLNHAFLFRNYLDKSNNGDTFNLVIDGIEDGAGNKIPAYTASFKVDYASDKIGPNWYDLKFGSSVGWYWNWDGFRCDTLQATQGQHNHIQTCHLPNCGGYLRNGSYYAAGDVTIATSWSVKRYPILSFRANQHVLRDGASFHLVLSAADGAVYTYSLLKAGGEANELNKEDNYTWKAGEVKHISINVAQLLKERGVPQEKIDAMTFTSVRFQRRGQQHNDMLDIDDFYIHGLPDDASKPDVMNLETYDISGVASVEATAFAADGKPEWTVSFADQHNIDLNKIRAKFTATGTRWILCQSKDKAGNLNDGIWLPVFGVYTPPPPPPAPKPEPPKPAAPAPAAKPAPAPAAAPAAQPAPAAKPAEAPKPAAPAPAAPAAQPAPAPAPAAQPAAKPAEAPKPAAQPAPAPAPAAQPAAKPAEAPKPAAQPAPAPAPAAQPAA